MIKSHAKSATIGSIQKREQVGLVSRREFLISCLAALVVSLVIIILEPSLFSLERGSHFNWVTLHSLSIVDHSRLVSGFVGYSRKLLELVQDGTSSFHYEYFNRYSVLLPLLANIFLDRFKESTEGYLLAAKQLMNLVYVTTLLFLYLSLRAMRFSRPVSLLSLLSVGASPLWLHYRPMFHFDQPGLLGYVLCLYGYTSFRSEQNSPARKSRKSILFLVLSVIGCLLGRSFITVFFLAAISITLQFQQSSSQLKKLSWTATTLGGVLVIASSLYAGLVEWLLNLNSDTHGVGFMDSSVMQSAMRRLGLPSAQWPELQKPQLDWSTAAKQSLEWIANLIPTWPFLLIVFLSLALLSKRLPALFMPPSPGMALLRPKRSSLMTGNQESDLVNLPNHILLTTFLASVAWLLFFKNLIVFHDYTVIFLLPFLAICAAFVYRSFLTLLEENIHAAKKRFLILAALFLLLCSSCLDGYIGSLRAWTVSNDHTPLLSSFYKEIDEYNLLSRSSSPKLPIRRDDEWVYNSPYAQGLLLEGDLFLNLEGGRAEQLQPPAFPLPKEALIQSAVRSRRKVAAGSLKQVFYREPSYYN